MNPAPPFPPVPDFLQKLAASLPVPDWMVAELQNRVVLFLNHVLMQEPQAQERLRRQQGKVVRVALGVFELPLAATRAGLLERAGPGAAPDLSVTLADTSPLVVAQTLLAGERPKIDIQGDVLLAAEVAWLVDNLRWDVEEDLSRWVGDAPAHTLVSQARAAAAALQTFVRRPS